MTNFIRKHWFWFFIVLCGLGTYYFYTHTTFISMVDYSQFKGTPAWDLAKAVKANDPDKIRRLMATGRYDINYRDPDEGVTLLSYAVANNASIFGKTKNSTTKALLECGADPNIYGYTKSSKGRTLLSTNAVIEAAQRHNYEMLKLLLEYGGDPNSQNKPMDSEIDPYDHTALISAIRTFLGPDNGSDEYDPIEFVRLLVEAGADMDKTTGSYQGGAIEACIIHDKMKSLLYLLENGANYNIKINKRGEELNILDLLRRQRYELDSEQQRYKRKVIRFLKAKGLDYDSCPIPQYMLEAIKRDYPNSWQEYIKRY